MLNVHFFPAIMLRVFQKLVRPSATRFFAATAEGLDPEMLVEDGDPQPKETTKRDQIRVVPVPRHPIFPRHPVRFRLSPDAFQALISDKTNNYVGAFVLKPREGKDELESAQALQ